MSGLSVADGDLELDSRGRLESTSGVTKVSQEIDYALATSSAIKAIFGTAAGTLQANEMLVRNAINDTFKLLIQRHARNTKLRSDERVVDCGNLSVVRLTKAEYEFYVDVFTENGVSTRLRLERVNNG